MALGDPPLYMWKKMQTARVWGRGLAVFSHPLPRVRGLSWASYIASAVISQRKVGSGGGGGHVLCREQFPGPT